MYPLEENTVIKFDFHNVSGTSKSIWYNIKFLREVDEDAVSE